MTIWLSNSQYRLALLSVYYDCSSSLPCSSGDGVLANVAFDWALSDNVPSLFRQSLEDSERRSSLAIGSIRGQARSHEHKS